MKKPTLESLESLLEDLAANLQHPVTGCEPIMASRYRDIMAHYQKATTPPTPEEALAEFCVGGDTSDNVAYLRNAASQCAVGWGQASDLLNALADHLEASADCAAYHANGEIPE